MLQDSCLCPSCRKPPGSLFKSMKGILRNTSHPFGRPCMCANEALSWGCIWRFRLIEATQKSRQASHRHLPGWRGTEGRAGIQSITALSPLSGGVLAGSLFTTIQGVVPNTSIKVLILDSSSTSEGGRNRGLGSVRPGSKPQTGESKVPSPREVAHSAAWCLPCHSTRTHTSLAPCTPTLPNRRRRAQLRAATGAKQPSNCSSRRSDL